MIIGLGRSGFAIARLLKNKGAEVVTTDSSPREKISDEILRWLDEDRITFHNGNLKDELAEDINLVVPSPGVPLDQQFFDHIRTRNIVIAGELALAAALYDKPIIAITGTNGKSTVTELIGEMLSSSGYKPFVGGNLGIPLAEHMLKPLTSNMAVLEVSSFQLDTAPYFRPAIAVLLNISPDHLDRYSSYEKYIASKFSIFKDQLDCDYGVINSDDSDIAENVSQSCSGTKKLYFGKECPREHPSAFITGSEIVVTQESDDSGEKYDTSDTVFETEPNIYNAAAAIMAARFFGCDKASVQQSLKHFKPLGHRMSLVGKVAGVEFYDDSKATNIGAVSAALKGFKTPVVLIAGGRDKGGDYRLMLEQVRKKVKAMILIGEARNQMAKVFEGATDVCVESSMEAAVARACEIALPGESVLLSPACASFDMFESYSHRGDAFRCAVEFEMNKMEM